MNSTRFLTTRKDVAVTLVIKEHNPTKLDLVVNELSLLDVDTIYISEALVVTKSSLTG